MTTKTPSPLGTFVADKLKEFRNKSGAAASPEDVAGLITDYKIFFNGASAAATALGADVTPVTRAGALLQAEEDLLDLLDLS